MHSLRQSLKNRAHTRKSKLLKAEVKEEATKQEMPSELPPLIYCRAAYCLSLV